MIGLLMSLGAIRMKDGNMARFVVTHCPQGADKVTVLEPAYATLEEAEARIEALMSVDETGVVAGDYGIDGPCDGEER